MKDETPRRGFLKGLTGFLGALVGAAAAVPGLGFLASPLREDTVAGVDKLVPVARSDEVASHSPRHASVTGSLRDAWLLRSSVELGACWLVRDAAGKVRAFSTVCPHLGCGV